SRFPNRLFGSRIRHQVASSPIWRRWQVPGAHLGLPLLIGPARCGAKFEFVVAQDRPGIHGPVARPGIHSNHQQVNIPDALVKDTARVPTIGSVGSVWTSVTKASQ